MKRVHVIVPGAAKVATTWLQHVLDWNASTWVPPHAQEIEFFDRHHGRGVDWYTGLYANAPTNAVTADVTPGYLSNPEVPGRVGAFQKRTGWQLRFVVSLGEPVDRLWSDYVMRRRKGDQRTLQQVLDDGALVDRGRYHRHLVRWLDRFDRDQFLIFLLDDLREDEGHVLDGLASSLGIDGLEESYAGRRVNPLRDRRMPVLDRLLTQAGRPLRWLGLTRSLHRIKRSRPVQALYSANKVAVEPTSAGMKLLDEVQDEYRDDVEALAQLIDQPDLTERWGYMGGSR